VAYVKEFPVQSRARAELIKLDAQVEKAIKESGVKDGVCHVYVPHTTAGVTINEGADPDVARDILARLAQLVPHGTPAMLTSRATRTATSRPRWSAPRRRCLSGTASRFSARGSRSSSESSMDRGAGAYWSA
jgi:hypothetical protein